MEQNTSNRLLVPLAVVIAGGLIAGAIYFGGNLENKTLNADGQYVTEGVDIVSVTEKDHILGNKNADLIIIEYSDTECIFCKIFHNTMIEVASAYSNQIAWVYRHFPIIQLHLNASKEAEATECANELGGNQAFWNYINRLFELTNSNDSLNPDELPKIAVAIGLDETAFNTCLSSGKYSEFITKSVEEAVKAGARGTPYSVIITKDGKKVVINGAESFESVKLRIDSLLSR